jgi:hypothetical protein
MDGLHKSALERLTSPDQLNQRLLVVTFRGWIALLCMVFLVIAILIWSFWGQIPVIVEGRGIVFDPEKTILVRSEIDGTVSEVYVNSGDQVDPGAELMSLKSPLIAQQLFEKQILATSLEDFLEKNTGLPSEEKEAIRKQILQVKADIEGLRFLKAKETIVAPNRGTIINLNTPIEGAVSTGTMLAWMVAPRGALEKQKICAIFPLESGEMIKEKMEAEIALASVNGEKYGQLFGTVTKVYPFITSLEQGPLRNLPVKGLHDYLTQGSQRGVIIEILPDSDPHTFTGYRWSSQNGPPFPITEGSVGVVKVVIETKKPISYLIPITEKTKK